MSLGILYSNGTNMKDLIARVRKHLHSDKRPSSKSSATPPSTPPTSTSSKTPPSINATSSTPVLKAAFAYKLLDGPGQIRILELLPRSDQRSHSGIACTITHVLLSAALYTAISYTWGSSEPSERMRVDGLLFYVRHNLLQMLFDLRHAEQKRTLWIDAICINQVSDTEERNSQVRLMGNIYRYATGVIVRINDGTRYYTRTECKDLRIYV